VIHIEKYHNDYLFPNPTNCEYLRNLQAFRLTYDELLLNNSGYKNSLRKLKETLHKYAPNGNISFSQFRDDLSCRYAHNLPVPDDLKDLYVLSDRYSALELTQESDQDLKLNCGLFIDLLKDNIISSVRREQQNKPLFKFQYFSVHDSTLNAILNALSLLDRDNHRWPPFAADFVLELWRMEKGRGEVHYYIKAFYLGKIVKLPFSKESNPELCNVSDFIEHMMKTSIEKSDYEFLCNRKFVK